MEYTCKKDILQQIDGQTLDFLTYICEKTEKEIVNPDFHLNADELTEYLDEALKCLLLWLNPVESIYYSISNYNQIEGIIKGNTHWKIFEINKFISELLPRGCPMFAYMKYIGPMLNKMRNTDEIRSIYKHSSLISLIIIDIRSIQMNKNTKPKILFEYKYLEERILGKVFEMSNPITIGKGPNSTIQINQDLDDLQFLIALNNKIFFLVCLSRLNLSLFKLPPRQKIRIKTGTYFMLSISEAFYVKECEHGQILKENFVNKLKNDKSIISPYKFIENKSDNIPYLKLICQMGEWNNREIEIITKEKCSNNPNGYRVGRKEECDLIIRNNEISLYHLNILFEEGLGFMLQDNNEKGSLNGSYIAIRSLENPRSWEPSDPFYVSANQEIIIKVTNTEFYV